jgi:hypothetical protein
MNYFILEKDINGKFHTPDTLPPWYPFNKRLGRPQGRAGLVEKTKVP